MAARVTDWVGGGDVIFVYRVMEARLDFYKPALHGSHCAMFACCLTPTLFSLEAYSEVPLTL